MVSRLVRRGLSLLVIFFLAGCNTVLMNSSGDIAAQQGHLIVISTLLMLLIIVPVITLTLVFAWRYRKNNTDATYLPDWDHSAQLELVIWGAPLLIIIALGLITWISTHTLDPYRPLSRVNSSQAVAISMKPINVQVVALDWKWLFIYPDLGIATVNEMAAPVDVPILFKITATSVMNSFFVPAMAGQIYAMPGMQTTLNAVINQPGEYHGLSANYSGPGFSDMRFQFHGLRHADFEKWVQTVKSQQIPLDRAAYVQLEKPSIREPVRRYAAVDHDLFHAIVNRCVIAGQVCIDVGMAAAINANRGHAHQVAGH
ncbi:MAG: hypothetical protein NVSMB6_23310 [Burkholderiaceae bacterium]